MPGLKPHMFNPAAVPSNKRKKILAFGHLEEVWRKLQHVFLAGACRRAAAIHRGPQPSVAHRGPQPSIAHRGPQPSIAYRGPQPSITGRSHPSRAAAIHRGLQPSIAGRSHPSRIAGRSHRVWLLLGRSAVGECRKKSPKTVVNLQEL